MGYSAQAAVPVTIGFAHDIVQANPGETFDVTVTAGTAIGLQGFRITLEYPTLLVQPQSVQLPGWSQSSSQITASNVRAAGLDAAPIGGERVLAIVTFQVLPSALTGTAAKFELSALDLNDGLIEATSAPASLAIGSGARVSLASNVPVTPNRQFAFHLRADNVSGLLGFEVSLEYDPRYFEFDQIQKGGLVASWNDSNIQAEDNTGTLNVAALDSQPVSTTANGDILLAIVLRSRANIPNGVLSPLTLRSLKLNDGLIPAAPISGSALLLGNQTNPPVPDGVPVASTCALLIATAAIALYAAFTPAK